MTNEKYTEKQMIEIVSKQLKKEYYEKLSPENKDKKILKQKQEEQRLISILSTRPRREIVNQIKKSVEKKFKKDVEKLNYKKKFETKYNDKNFCKDMTLLIENTQKSLDKLKINGKYYCDVITEEI
tara:strand:- start:189 stop:566 length:378 start_codon:yes stop_codon:yes gene_type:complete